MIRQLTQGIGVIGINADEPSVYNEFENSVHMKDNRYVVSQPWHSNLTWLPSNLSLTTK